MQPSTWKYLLSFAALFALFPASAERATADSGFQASETLEINFIQAQPDITVQVLPVKTAFSATPGATASADQPPAQSGPPGSVYDYDTFINGSASGSQHIRASATSIGKIIFTNTFGTGVESFNFNVFIDGGISAFADNPSKEYSLVRMKSSITMTGAGVGCFSAGPSPCGWDVTTVDSDYPMDPILGSAIDNLAPGQSDTVTFSNTLYGVAGAIPEASTILSFGGMLALGGGIALRQRVNK